MSVQSKGKKSYKKQNVEKQNAPHTGFKNLVFGHQFANAGETTIPFNALILPSEWPQAGLSNPSAAYLLGAQLQVFKKNITVTSSVRGLIQKSEYIVRANGIEFLNITSFVNEVFEVEVADLMVTGNLIVDMKTIRVQGELANTETDFNMGYEFDVYNEEIIVFRDGIQMFRSDNNDDSGATGNYYYLDGGTGRASVIRFFEPAVGVEPVLVATTGGVVDSANVSTFQQIESLQGQLDAIIPTVAALADVPESNFRVGPNNVDLKTFGDKVLTLFNAEVPIIGTWQNGGATIIEAVTTNPTKGSINTDKVIWRRDGQDLIATYTFYQTSAGTNGSGAYLFKLPNSLLADTSIITATTITTANQGGTKIGDANINNGIGNTFSHAHAVMYDDSRFFLTQGPAATDAGAISGATGDTIGSTSFALGGPIIIYKISIRVPIQGWSATQTLKEQLGL